MSRLATPQDVLDGKAQWSCILGDCLEVLPGLPDKSVDHVITDPPYGLHVYQSVRRDDGAKAALNDLTSQHELGTWSGVEPLISPCAEHYLRLAVRWMLVFSDVESGDKWRAALGPAVVRSGAWVKPNPMPQFTGDRPAQGFELCTIAHGPARKRWNGGGRAAVWNHQHANGSWEDRHDHPCPKPLALMLELVSLFTDAGDVVLDPFAGSATTGVACLRLGRRFIGIEKDAGFHATAVDRLEAESRGQSLREFRAGQMTLFTEKARRMGGG